MAAEIPEVSDDVFVRRALSGETQAFDPLFDRYYTRLLRFCLRRTRDRSRSEDIAQETLWRAFRFLNQFDTKRPMWPWLKTIAENLIYRSCLATSEEQPLVAAEELGAASVQDTADLLGERDLLKRALRELPSSQRTAVVLRYLEAWSSNELADLLGISNNAVEHLLSRARIKLRAEYRRLSDEGRGKLGLLFPPLTRLRHRLREWTARIRGENELLPAAAGPHFSPLVSLAAVGVAVGLVAIGMIRDPNTSQGSRPTPPSASQMNSSSGGPHSGVGATFKGSSRSARVSSGDVATEGGVSATASVEVSKNSFRAKLESKLPGDHETETAGGIDTDAECDYSAVQQALCDAVDLLPDQN